MRTAPLLLVSGLLAAAAPAETPAAGPPTVVVCAPGYPGSTTEAQPTMDAFAAALGERALLGRAGLAAVYHEAEGAGLSRLGKPDATFALVPLSFFLAHEKEPGLHALAQAVRKGGEAGESWSLVAGKGLLARPASLEGWQLVSLSAYAPRFVKGTALGAWGPVPPGTKLVPSGAVLSALRKASAGERVAVLLDGDQAKALGTLPFAGKLETVYRSPVVPSSVFCAVGARAPKALRKAVVDALLSLGESPAGAAALEGIRVTRFVAVDEAGLAGARRAYAAVPENP